MEKIKQKAGEIRQLLSQHLSESVLLRKDELNQLARQLEQCREQNSVLEEDLQRWKEVLEKLERNINQPSADIIEQIETPLIPQFHIQSFGEYRS